jgi:hypothetical protein
MHDTSTDNQALDLCVCRTCNSGWGSVGGHLEGRCKCVFRVMGGPRTAYVCIDNTKHMTQRGRARSAGPVAASERMGGMADWGGRGDE